MPATHASIAETMSDPSAFATTMVAGLLADWGADFPSWHPLTVDAEVRADFGVDLPQSRLDALMAGVAVLTSDRFFKSLPDFVVLCGALNGEGYDPNHWDPPSAVDAAWAISEAVLLEHLILGRSRDDEEPFSAEIRHFVGAVLAEEGIFDPPDVLRIALDSGAKSRALSLASWSADPGMYGAIHETSRSKSDAIRAEIKGRLRLLVGQLERLFGEDLPDLGVDKLR